MGTQLEIPLTRDHIPIWKTITLGEYKTPKEYRKAIEAVGMRLGPHVKELFEDHGFACASEVVQVDLVLLTAAQLGFTQSNEEVGYLGAPRLSQIYDEAEALGLALCPAEVGPALRLAYKDQLGFGDGWCEIAMNPFTNAGASAASYRRHRKRWVNTPNHVSFPYRLVFSLWVDSAGASLSCSNVEPDLCRKPEERFIFLKPREQPRFHRVKKFFRKFW